MEAHAACEENTKADTDYKLIIMTVIPKGETQLALIE